MYQIILCTCPDQKTAEYIAGQMVEHHLAACVNIVPGITSVYQWRGKIESTQEHMLIIKSQTEQYQSIEKKSNRFTPMNFPKLSLSLLSTAFPNTCNG